MFFNRSLIHSIMYLLRSIILSYIGISLFFIFAFNPCTRCMPWSKSYSESSKMTAYQNGHNLTFRHTSLTVPKMFIPRGFHFDDFHRLLPPHACSVCRLVCMERVEKRKRDEKLRVRGKERRIRSLRKGRGASHNSVTASSPQLLIPHFNQTFLQPAQCRPQECLFLLSYYKERNWHGLYPRCRDCP